MTGLIEQIITVATCVATVIIHVAIARLYSRKYVPLIGKAALLWEDNEYLYDDTPLKAAYPSADRMSAQQLRAALAREIRDIWTLVDNTSEVFYHVTDGRISKPMTRADDVCSVHDDLVTQAVEYAIKDAMEEDLE